MSDDALVKKGNDIARQFAHLPPQHAAHEVATHLVKFWEPRMLDQLDALVRAGDGRLDPLLAAARHALAHGRQDDGELAEPSGG